MLIDGQNDLSDAKSFGKSHEPILYASLRATNAAATHLLQLVRALAPANSYRSDCLVVTDSHIEYQIRLDPAQNHFTWRIGTGRRAESQTAGEPDVDFLLCPPGKCLSSSLARKAIGPVHGHFQFHFESGVLIFVGLSEKPTIYRQNSRVSTTLIARRQRFGAAQSVCVMCQSVNRLSLGDYGFSLIYARSSGNEMLGASDIRDRVLARAGGRSSGLLAILPPLGAVLLRHVLVYRSDSHPRGSAMHIGVNIYSGQPVRVSEVPFGAKTEKRCRKELENLHPFNSDYSDGVVGLIDYWCEHGLSPPCGLDKIHLDPSFTERVYYSRALIDEYWSDVSWKYVTLDTKLKYFAQSLAGLRTIHNRGFCHGRLNPRSLALLSNQRTETRRAEGENLLAPAHHLCEPVQIRTAIDQVTCIRQAPSRHDKPNRDSLWAAPEVLESSPEKPYDQKADIFSLALCWINAFWDIGWQKFATRMDDRGYSYVCEVLTMIEPELTGQLYKVLKAMLDWDPQARPTAELALCQLTWQFVDEMRAELADLDDEVRVKRARLNELESEEGSEDVGGRELGTADEGWEADNSELETYSGPETCSDRKLGARDTRSSSEDTERGMKFRMSSALAEARQREVEGGKPEIKDEEEWKDEDEAQPEQAEPTQPAIEGQGQMAKQPRNQLEDDDPNPRGNTDKRLEEPRDDEKEELQDMLEGQSQPDDPLPDLIPLPAYDDEIGNVTHE